MVNIFSCSKKILIGLFLFNSFNSFYSYANQDAGTAVLVYRIGGTPSTPPSIPGLGPQAWTPYTGFSDENINRAVVEALKSGDVSRLNKAYGEMEQVIQGNAATSRMEYAKAVREELKKTILEAQKKHQTISEVAKRTLEPLWSKVESGKDLFGTVDEVNALLDRYYSSQSMGLVDSEEVLSELLENFVTPDGTIRGLVYAKSDGVVFGSDKRTRAGQLLRRQFNETLISEEILLAHCSTDVSGCNPSIATEYRNMASALKAMLESADRMNRLGLDVPFSELMYSSQNAVGFFKGFASGVLSGAIQIAVGGVIAATAPTWVTIGLAGYAIYSAVHAVLTLPVPVTEYLEKEWQSYLSASPTEQGFIAGNLIASSLDWVLGPRTLKWQQSLGNEIKSLAFKKWAATTTAIKAHAKNWINTREAQNILKIADVYPPVGFQMSQIAVLSKNGLADELLAQLSQDDLKILLGNHIETAGVVGTATGKELNKLLLKIKPDASLAYQEGTFNAIFRTSNQTNWVRFHDTLDNSKGVWFVPGSAVAHMSAADIQAHLMLPKPPNWITDIQIPETSLILASHVGVNGYKPLSVESKSPAIQYQLLDDIKRATFGEPRRIGD